MRIICVGGRQKGARAQHSREDVGRGYEERKTK